MCRSILPRLKRLSPVLAALALAGCTPESKEEKPDRDRPPAPRAEAPKPQTVRPADEKQAKAIAEIEPPWR